MMKKNRTKILQGLVVVVVVAAILIGVIATPDTEASSYYASYIEQLTGVKVDYESYFDSAVVQSLPESVKPEDRISVIIHRYI